MSTWRNIIEPEAVHATNGANSCTLDQQVGLSIAISLKRIADALTYPEPAVNASNLRQILSDIEMNTRPGR